MTGRGDNKATEKAYAANDVLMVCEMGLACLATVNLVAGEIGVVRQPHDANAGILSSQPYVTKQLRRKWLVTAASTVFLLWRGYVESRLWTTWHIKKREI